MSCPNCNYGPLPSDAKFCLRCGKVLKTTHAVDEAITKKDVDPATGSERLATAEKAGHESLVLQTYGTRGQRIHLPPTLKHPSVGREHELKQITNTLRERQTVLLYGEAGFGKTDLAAQAAQLLYNDSAFPDGIIWVDKVGTATIEAVCDAVAIHLGNNGISRLEPHAKLSAIRKLLEALDLLLVLDDLISPETADAFVKFCKPCDMALLATSREIFPGFDLDIEVNQLDPATTIALFRDRALPIELAGEISKLLEENPLALVYAAGCVRIDVQKLKTRLLKKKKHLQRQQPTSTTANVRSSFEYSYDKLPRSQRRLFTHLTAFFTDSTDIELLAEVCALSPAVTKRMVQHLVDQELIERESEKVCFHAVAGEFGREILGAELADVRDQILAASLAFAAKYREPTTSNYDRLEDNLGNLSGAVRYALTRKNWKGAWELAEQLFDLLAARSYWTELQVMGHLGLKAAEQTGDEKAHAGFLYKVASTLKVQGRDQEAEALARQSLAISERRNDLPDVAKTLGLLGMIANFQRDYMEAKNTYEKALKICQQINDRDGAGDCLYQLGLISQSLLDYQQAEKYFKDSLQIRRETFGNKHPDVAASLNALAMLYEWRGEYTSAESTYKEALEIYEAVPDAYSQDFAGALNNLANLYYAMGDFQKAENRYRQGLEIRRKHLPKDHPDIAQSLNNLATLYSLMGNFVEGAALAQQAIDIYSAALGESHPDFADALNNLANIYYASRDYATAEPLYQQALEVKRKALGPAHPDVAQILNNLALLYETTGRYSEAMALLEEARSIYRTSLGDMHPYLAQTLNNLALAYEAQGEYAKAQPLLEEALKIRRHALRPDHPDIAQSLTNLGLLYESVQEYEKAVSLMEEAINVYRAAFGDKHPFLAQSMCNLALVYEIQEKYDLAEPLYRQSQKIYFETLGETHPEHIAVLTSLAELNRTLKKYGDAAGFYSRLLEIYRRTKGAEQFVAQSLYNLGSIAGEQADYPKAEEFFKESLHMKKTLGDQRGEANVLDQLGQTAYAQGKYDDAEEYYNKSLEISRKLEDQVGVARSVHQLGLIASARNHYDEAEGFYDESLKISESLGSQSNMARNLEQLSQVAQEKGNIEEARSLDERSKVISERLNSVAPVREVLKTRSIDDLRVITSDLGLDWESLPGEGHNAKATELVVRTYREGKEKELQDILQIPSDIKA